MDLAGAELGMYRCSDSATAGAGAACCVNIDPGTAGMSFAAQLQRASGPAEPYGNSCGGALRCTAEDDSPRRLHPEACFFPVVPWSQAERPPIKPRGIIANDKT